MKTIAALFLSVCLAGITSAQDVAVQQRILQYCLNIEDVSASIHAQKINGEDAIAMASENFLSDQLKLSVGAIPVRILSNENLFFNNMDKYIRVTKLEIKSDKADVVLICTDGSTFKIELKGRNNFQEIVDFDVHKE